MRKNMGFHEDFEAKRIKEKIHKNYRGLSRFKVGDKVILFYKEIDEKERKRLMEEHEARHEFTGLKAFLFMDFHYNHMTAEECPHCENASYKEVKKYGTVVEVGDFTSCYRDSRDEDKGRYVNVYVPEWKGLTTVLRAEHMRKANILERLVHNFEVPAQLPVEA
jgi:hypothetical protein